jgi:hypothetical protein
VGFFVAKLGGNMTSALLLNNSCYLQSVHNHPIAASIGLLVGIIIGTVFILKAEDVI